MGKSCFACCPLFEKPIGVACAWVYLTVFYGSDFVDKNLDANVQGAAQRTTIAAVLFFIMTFTLDFQAWKDELDVLPPEIVGAPVGTYPMSTATPMVAPAGGVEMY